MNMNKNNFEKQLENLPQATLSREADLAIQDMIEENFAKKEKKRVALFPNFGFLFSRYAMSFAVVLLFAVIIGQQTYFSINVVYGDKLYDFKQTLETVRLSLAKTSLQRVGIYSDLAQRRLAEAEVLAEANGESLSFNFIKTALAQGEGATPLTITLGAYEYNNDKALESVEEMSAPEEIEVALDILGVAQERHEKRLETIAKKVGLEISDEVVVTVATVLEETKANKNRVKKAVKLVKETVETRASQGQNTPALQVRLRVAKEFKQDLGVTTEEQKEQVKAKLALLSGEVERLKDVLETEAELSFEDQRALNILETRLQRTEETIETGQVNEADELIQSTAAVKNNLFAFRQAEPVTYTIPTPATGEDFALEEVENQEEYERRAIEIPATTFVQEQPVVVLAQPRPVSGSNSAGGAGGSTAVAPSQPIEQNLKPDLVINDLVLEDNKIYVKVGNVGLAKVAGNYPVQVRLYDRNTGITYYESLYSIFDPGSEVSIGPIEVSSGRDYNFLATVDDYNRIAEDNEGNNTLNKQLSVQSKTAGLYVTSFGGDAVAYVGDVAEIFKLNFAAREADLTIRNLELNRLGTAYGSDLGDWQLYVNYTLRAEGSQMGDVIQFYNVNAFIPADHSIAIIIKAKVLASGRTVYLGLNSNRAINAYAMTPGYSDWKMTSSLPLHGSTTTLLEKTQVEPEVRARLESGIPSSTPPAQNLVPGTKDKTVSVISYSAREGDAYIHQFAVGRDPIYDINSDIERISIYIGSRLLGSQYLDQSEASLKTFNFSGNPIYVAKDTHVELDIRVDLRSDAQPGHYLKLGIAKDNFLAYTTNSELVEIQGSSITFGSKHNIVAPEVVVGSLTMSLAADSPLGFEIHPGEEVAVAKFDFTARDEAIKINGLKINFAIAAIRPYIEYVKAYKDNASAGNQLGVVRLSDHYAEFDFTDFIVPKDVTTSMLVLVKLSGAPVGGSTLSCYIEAEEVEAIGWGGSASSIPVGDYPVIHARQHTVTKSVVAPPVPVVEPITPSVETWKAIAQQLGLSTSQFNTCLDSGAKAGKVSADKVKGIEAGVTGTPTSFINGELVGGALPYEIFKSKVEEHLNNVSQTTVLDETDHLRGFNEAAVILVEYSDFECPFCVRHKNNLEELRAEFGSQLAIAFRHFTLDFHEHAQKAAEASECAADQGKFWEMHDEIFEVFENQ